jgi:hypothetical protein
MRLQKEMQQADGFQGLLDCPLQLFLRKVHTGQAVQRPPIVRFGLDGVPKSDRRFLSALTLQKRATDLLAKKWMRDAAGIGSFDMTEGLGSVSFRKSQFCQRELDLGRTLLLASRVTVTFGALRL